MSKATLYDFNPRNTGLYEAHLWKAYYDRDWPLALLPVYRMLWCIGCCVRSSA